MKLSHLAVGVLALLCLGSPALGQSKKKKGQEPEAPDPYLEKLDKYEEYIKRDPFKHHTEGRTTLANSRDARGLAVLTEDYKKPHAYDQYTRYTLTHLIAQNFDKDEFLPQLDAMRAEFDDEVDMWMWVRFLKIHINRKNDEEAIKIATTAKKYLHRAAAILALGQSRSGRIKDAIVQNCLEFPRKAADRCALLGAMAGALHHNRRQVNDPDYRAALTAYIGLLDPKLGLTHVSKIQMSRHLQWILDGPALFVNPEPWLEILNRGEVRKKKKYETSASPSFFGIETHGERYCYVIDMSDTMCTPIDSSAKPDNVPITGRKRPKRKKGFVPSESDLPWNLIDTRWDLAREQLRISLLRLPDDKWFSVIWFGDDAGTFKSCKGLIRATKRNVDRVIAELDAIKTKPKKTDGTAPYGQLKGKTNMHAGLQLAFSLTKKGFVEEHSYVHPKVLTEGCDTIFLLSDGAPSWDPFALKAINYDNTAGVETTEYATEKKVTSHLHYPGPYVNQNWLVEDVKRMNAFRRIRMHCVGLGEAKMDLLKGLAKMGNGKTFSMGAKKKK